MEKSKNLDNKIKTEPITIPENKSNSSPQVYSTSNESFVFVELNTPFASDENPLNSFFCGPAPTFLNNQESSTDDIFELSQQLAELEYHASQIDSFVESVCIEESEELKTAT